MADDKFIKIVRSYELSIVCAIKKDERKGLFEICLSSGQKIYYFHGIINSKLANKVLFARL